MKNKKIYFVIILLSFIITTSIFINSYHKNAEINIKNMYSKEIKLTQLKADTQNIKQKIQELYNIELNLNISATDEDNDGEIDTFNDPNNIITLIKNIKINNNPSFLLSINNDLTKLFLWDTTTDEIKQVTYEVGKARTQPETDPINYTVKITINVEETEWTYIKIEDALTNFMCSNFPYNVKRCDETIVSENKIWVEDETTYLLDTPCEKYYFIFTCEEEDLKFLFDVKLELTKQKIQQGNNVEAIISLKNVGDIGTVNGTLTYSIYSNNELIWMEKENISTVFTQVVTKTLPLKDLTPGQYTCEVILNYDTDKTASASEEFTINETQMSITTQIAVLISIIAAIAVIYLIYSKKKK